MRQRPAAARKAEGERRDGDDGPSGNYEQAGRGEPVESDSLAYRLCRLCVYAVLSAALALTVVDALVDAPIEAKWIWYPESPKFVGRYAVNDELSRAERLLENVVAGPEHLEFADDGALYTGLADGRIVRIVGERVVAEWRARDNIALERCGRFDTEPLCGRPLGLKLNAAQTGLYVVDTHFGLQFLDFATGEFSLVLPAGLTVNGSDVVFMNSVALINDSFVAVSHSSSKWDRRYYPYVIFEGVPDSRVIGYDLKTGAASELATKLHFANGLHYSDALGALYIAETTTFRIRRHFTRGPHRGRTFVFATLPCLPDNLAPSADGRLLWVSCHSVRTSMHDYLANKPRLRKLITKVVPIERLTSLLQWASPTHGLAIALDLRTGGVVRSLHDAHFAALRGCSHVAEHDGHLYCGSVHERYIGKVKL